MEHISQLHTQVVEISLKRNNFYNNVVIPKDKKNQQWYNLHFGKNADIETTTSQFTKAMPENNLLEDIIPIDKKFKVC